MKEHELLAAVDLDAELRLGPAHEGQVFLVELLRPEGPHFQQFLAGVALATRLDAVEHPRVPVADDARAIEPADPLYRAARPWADSEIPETDEPVDRFLVESREYGLERREIAVKVRDEADAHSGGRVYRAQCHDLDTPLITRFNHSLHEPRARRGTYWARLPFP